MKEIGFSFAVLFLFIFFCSLGCLKADQQANITFYNDTAFELVDRHLKAMQSGNLYEAWHEMTTPEFRSFTSYSDFIKMIQKVPPLGKFTLAILEDSTFSPETSYFRAQLVDQTQTIIGRVEYLLTRSSKGWKVHTFGATTINTTLAQSSKSLRHKTNGYFRKPYLQGS